MWSHRGWLALDLGRFCSCLSDYKPLILVPKGFVSSKQLRYLNDNLPLSIAANCGIIHVIFRQKETHSFYVTQKIHT